ncbi:beta-propeller domain-containing protein, partial [Candidatus Bathyarchaeota archaeon]|nr:beta-propeller domain-containing protein [Candidatus Bathyarchaeota archaeon]
PIIWEPPTTTVKVYDISDKENPTLSRDFSIDGNYFNSRMIGNYVYIIATMYTYRTTTDIALPRIHTGNETETIPAKEIYYSNLTDSSYTFTTIVALNIENDNQEPTHETILMGGTSSIYVSQNNIYLTFPDYTWQENETMKTKINRAKIDQEKITFVAQGQVPGYLLNQFSMDEYNDYFRITTTLPSNWRTFAEQETSKNNVYVLDMDLNIVGQIEDLAPGEQIYSTRFMGNRCYMVTFRNIDPLFVIDLSDPTSPTVLG